MELLKAGITVALLSPRLDDWWLKALDSGMDEDIEAPALDEAT